MRCATQGGSRFGASRTRLRHSARPRRLNRIKSVAPRGAAGAVASSPTSAFAFKALTAAWVVISGLPFLAPTVYLQRYGLLGEATVPLVAFLWVSSSAYLAAIPMLAALVNAAESLTICSLTYGRVAFHYSVFNLALIATHVASWLNGTIATSAMLGVAGISAVWGLAACRAFAGRGGAIVTQEIKEASQLSKWRPPLLVSLFYGVAAISTYALATVLILTPVAPAFPGVFSGLTDHFRRQVGVGLLLVGALTSVLKSAAEHGRLKGSTFRSFNWGLVVVVSFTSLSFAWARRHGMPVRPLVFWAVMVFLLLHIPTCWRLATVADDGIL